MITKVGKLKISSEDHANIKFESIAFYTDLAKKMIGYMGPKYYKGLAKQMIQNEDAVSFVAEAIMMGDWRWKEQGIEGKKHKNLNSYRNQCGIWAIKTYIAKQNSPKSKLKQTDYSTDYMNDDGDDMYDIIEDVKQEDPAEIVMKQEESELLKERLKSIMDSVKLSKRQKEYIGMYYNDGSTLETIAKKYSITREGVRQGIKAAIQKIRKSL